MHNLQTILPNLLVLLSLGFILFNIPRRWKERVPERLIALVVGIGLIPFDFLMLWYYIVIASSGLYLVFGWTNWQLALATIGFYIFWFIGKWVMGQAPPPVKGYSHGSASWQTLEDAKRIGRITLHNQAFGFALGHMGKMDSKTHDSRLRYMGHVLTCAPTGSERNWRRYS